jgi:hypothetical protein
MKKLLLKILFFLYRKEYYAPLSKLEIDKLLTKLATTPGLENLPAYLDQCSTTARNKFLYSQDEIYKGIIFAFISLRDQIASKAPKKVSKLTQEEEVTIMKKRGY